MNITLYDKKALVDMITLRILRWGNGPGKSRWALFKPNCPPKQESRSQGRRHVKKQAVIGGVHFDTEEGART